jgi:hypothetical protein
MTDLQKHGQKLLSEALTQLWEAMLELSRPTSPQTPLPRPPAKPIKIARGLEVRVQVGSGVIVYFLLDGVCCDRWVASKGGCCYNIPLLVKNVMPHLSHPRALAHCLRQLRWLTAWMRKRAEGRRRAAAEILRQQRKWVEMLESEAALQELAR